MRSIAAAALLLAGCALGPAPTPPLQASWPVTTVTVGDRELRVVEAVDSRIGLAHVSDIEALGDVDGMLFDHGREVDPAVRGFWMQDVRFALDIAFFAADGSHVGGIRMPTCDDDCPIHRAPARFRWALETPAGALDVQPGDRLAVEAPAATSFVPGPGD